MTKGTTGGSGRGSGFRIEGQVTLERADSDARHVRLKAFAFDRRGRLLGESVVDPEGRIAMDLAEHSGDVKFYISGEEDAGNAVQSSVYAQTILPEHWIKHGSAMLFRPEVLLEPELWWPWRRRRICISGHVRKVSSNGGFQTTCPVSYVKVEVFDVDREWCWWPWLVKWWKYLDPRVIRIPELVRERPPIPDPDPGPLRIAEKLSSRPAMGLNPRLDASLLDEVALNPQPLPPMASMSAAMSAGSTRMFNPQPDPPRDLEELGVLSAANMGFLSKLNPRIADALSGATLTSRIAPWLIFRHCFYSRREVCETYTDCDGYFRCCFRWPRWHFRNGHFRYDPYPDIILRVTQTINGVDHVVYMDPYTSTRWNSGSAHIDLNLDDEDIVCGAGCGGTLPGTSQAAILQIGSDPIYLIDQADGKYHTGTPNESNGAYQGSVYVKGDFSLDLKTGPKRYYKISWARQSDPNNFTPIQTPLSVLRAAFLGTFDPYLIGPQPSGPVAGLYEVQDANHWWINPGPGGAGDALVLLESRDIVADEEGLILRMEVFDQNGAKMNAIQFPHHGGNGSGLDPNPVPIVIGQQDVKVYIDNKPMSFDLTTPATNACGVVEWSPSLALSFDVQAQQENGRVHAWDLKYVKGTDPTRIPLGGLTYPAGQSPVNETVSGNAMLVEPVTPSNPTGQLQSTCAFALLLNAWLHCRDNWGWIYAGEKAYAIAIEKCPPCNGAADTDHG